MYGTILDTPDFLYEVITKEPFVNKQILGYVTNNIIQIAGTDEALLNSAKAVLSAFKGALPDHEHQIDQTIRACSYAFKNNNERVLTINEALGLLG